MRTSHALLLRLYHDPQYEFSEVTICYLDRGAPADRTCVTGGKIVHLDAYYMEITSRFGRTAIPYHRIRTIGYRDSILWEWTRPPSAHADKKEG